MEGAVQREGQESYQVEGKPGEDHKLVDKTNGVKEMEWWLKLEKCK